MSNIFSEAVNQFPYSNLWALLFFCMVSEDHCRIETIEKLLPFCAAVHPWSGLPVWHSAGGHPGCCGPQNISWHNEKRISNWYIFFIKAFSELNGTILFRNHMLAAVCDVHDVLPQRGQLHLHHLWQLLWQHPAPCHRFVWVHWSCLLLWSPKVVKILFSTTWNPQFIQIFPLSGSVRTSS